MQPFVANTDRAWFDFLSMQMTDGRVDEVNFWLPRAQRTMKTMSPGHPVFFRLKKGVDSVAGFGFFAHFQLLSLHDAWEVFGWRNGDPSRAAFFDRILGYRLKEMDRASAMRRPLGCTVLREAHFWNDARWLPWGGSQRFQRNIVQGKTVKDPVLAERLMLELGATPVPEEFAPAFQPVDVDERRRSAGTRVAREGQGTFRLRLLDAYGRRCAITGERTEPVLDAAHIQSYLGPRSNHVQNGLLMTKEFHALFDRGLVTVTPDYVVRVSDAIRDQWSNGKRYYAFDGERIREPLRSSDRPSREALELHVAERFVA